MLLDGAQDGGRLRRPPRGAHNTAGHGGCLLRHHLYAEPQLQMVSKIFVPESPRLFLLDSLTSSAQNTV